MPPQDQIARLRSEAIRYATSIVPGLAPLAITIHLPGNVKLKVPIPRKAAKATSATVVAPPAAEGEDNAAIVKILDVLSRATHPMKPLLIARKAGLSPKGSYFREGISRLRKEKRIYRPDPDNAAYWLSGREIPN